MNRYLIALTLWTALGCSLIGGLFFAFSNFVMKALASVPPDRGIASMQAINITVLNPGFFSVFFGTALACLGLLVFAVIHWREPGMVWLVAGSLLYLVGVILVTVLCNVPRNDLLASLDPTHADSVPVWRDYLAGWTAWNHVRTVAGLAAAASFLVALWQTLNPANR